MTTLDQVIRDLTNMYEDKVLHLTPEETQNLRDAIRCLIVGYSFTQLDRDCQKVLHDLHKIL